MGRDRLHHMEPSFTAVRAVHPFDSSHASHERLHRLQHDRIGRRCLQRRACGGEVRGLVRGSQQTVVANALEANIDKILEANRLDSGAAKAKGITAVVFDRGGYRYGGQVKVLADTAREGGLTF